MRVEDGRADNSETSRLKSASLFQLGAEGWRSFEHGIRQGLVSHGHEREALWSSPLREMHLPAISGPPTC